MERNFYSEGFESFLKDKADQYKLYPSEKVWKNINRQLHPRRKWPYLTAALLLLGIGVGGKFYLDDKINQNNSITSSTDKGFAVAEQALKDGSFDVQPDSQEEGMSTAPSSLQVSSATRPTRANRLVVAARNPLADNIPDELLVINNSQHPSGDVSNGFNYPDVPASTLRNNPLFPAYVDPLAKKRVQVQEESPLIIDGVAENNVVKSSQVKRQIKVAELLKAQEALEGESVAEKVITRIKKVKNRTDWQIYVSPSVSYRKLVGRASDVPFNYTGTITNPSAGAASDVNLAVNHRPSMGLEVGTSLIYPLTKFLRVKAGFQLNYNRYDIKAFSYKPEVATLGIDNSGISARSINTVSYYRNYSGNSMDMLKNERFMVSIPLGVELELFGNDRVKFNVASSIQPTYVFNNNSYMISTNLKNYAQEPSLNRRWNVNAGMEAFLSIRTGRVNWVTGPQVRYQLLSSYKSNYPISEHLIDYGFKVGITTTLK
jgi:hypothetical protein